eukprot:8478100-Alexandrium_andersonii.AAC.1
MSTSAGMRASGHFSNWASPGRVRPRTYNCPAARYRMRPMPARRPMPTAALMSASACRSTVMP